MSADPVALRYDAARSDGLGGIEAALWTLPAIAQFTRPSSAEAVHERLRITDDYRIAEQRTSVVEMLSLMHQILPIAVSYPGWIMAGAISEMLWLLLTSERDFMVSIDGRAARGLSELDIAIRRVWDVRQLVAGTLRSPHDVIGPSEIEHARQGLWETRSLLRGLPLEGPDFVEYLNYVDLIEEYLDEGDTIVTTEFTIEPKAQFIATAALGVALAGLDDEARLQRDGDQSDATGAGYDDSDLPDFKLCPKVSLDKDGKPSVSVDIKTEGGVTVEDLLKIVKVAAEEIVNVAQVIGKVFSALLIFWLFIDSDEEPEERPLIP